MGWNSVEHNGRKMWQRGDGTRLNSTDEIQRLEASEAADWARREEERRARYWQQWGESEIEVDVEPSELHPWAKLALLLVYAAVMLYWVFSL